MDSETDIPIQMSVKDRMNLFENKKETIIKPVFDRDSKANILLAKKEIPVQPPKRSPGPQWNNSSELVNATKTNEKSESLIRQERELNLNKGYPTRNLPEPPPLVRPPPKKSQLMISENIPSLSPDPTKTQEIKYSINFPSKVQSNLRTSDPNYQKAIPPPVKPPPRLSDLKKQSNPTQNFQFNPENETEISTEEPKLNSPLTRVLSPTGEKIIHPPLPPPPISEKSNKTKPVENNMPILPPPPAKTPKKTNVLVGWVKSQNSESKNDEGKMVQSQPKENQTKPIEESKPRPPATMTVPNQLHNKNKATEPPPIVVPPPSLQVVQKIKEREPSPSRSVDNSNSVRSSVQSGIANEEYDEDDSLSAEPWFFNVTKEVASTIMKNNMKKGAYLMRPSENNQYVLMVRFDATSIKKFKIQKYNDGWILGDPTKSKKLHPDLLSLMNHFITNGVKFGTATIQLKEPAQNN